MVRLYHRLIEWVDRPSALLRLAIAFITAWAIFFAQVSTFDNVPPYSIDKGVYCLHALGHTLSMAVFRSLFPWLVAAQIAGVVLFALRIVPLVWLPTVVVPLFWGVLVTPILRGGTQPWICLVMSDARLNANYLLKKYNYRWLSEVARLGYRLAQLHGT